MRSMLFALSLLITAAPALAQTQFEMNRQAGAEWKRADAEMTAEWKRIHAAMKARDTANTSRGGGFGYAASLLASQRAWLRFRDAHCVIASAEFQGGSLQPMAQSQCLARLTRERVDHLRRLRWQR